MKSTGMDSIKGDEKVLKSLNSPTKQGLNMIFKVTGKVCIC